MSRLLRLREVSEEEAKQLRQLSTSRTESARLVQRAKIIQLMLDTPKLPADKAKATYKDGVLHITLPKAEEAKPKQIKINSVIEKRGGMTNVCYASFSRDFSRVTIAHVIPAKAGIQLFHKSSM